MLDLLGILIQAEQVGNLSSEQACAIAHLDTKIDV